MADCLFCRIARHEIPARIVHEDEDAVAFDDIYPQAPVHVLVVPRKHVESLNDLAPEDDALVDRLHRVAAQVAAKRGVAGSGWRLAVNVGRDANQIVPHVHLHVLGGRGMGWPPG